MSEEEFQRFLRNIKAEFEHGEEEYYLEGSFINALNEEQKLELLMFAERYAIRVNTIHRFAAFKLEVFLSELADKYALLLK